MNNKNEIMDLKRSKEDVVLNLRSLIKSNIKVAKQINSLLKKEWGRVCKNKNIVLGEISDIDIQKIFGEYIDFSFYKKPTMDQWDKKTIFVGLMIVKNEKYENVIYYGSGWKTYDFCDRDLVTEYVEFDLSIKDVLVFFTKMSKKLGLRLEFDNRDFYSDLRS